MTTCLCYPPRSEQWFSKVETETFCIHYEPIRFDGQSIIKAVPQRLIFTLGVTQIVTVWLILLVGWVPLPVPLRVGLGRFTRNSRIYCWHLTAESLSDYYCFIFSPILTINQSSFGWLSMRPLNSYHLRHGFYSAAKLYFLTVGITSESWNFTLTTSCFTGTVEPCMMSLNVKAGSSYFLWANE